MTMARVEAGQVVQVGVPDEMRPISRQALEQQGWLLVKGPRPPSTDPASGYRWEYGEPWTAHDDHVTGIWAQQQRPQPYPSWGWVDGEGWVPPTPMPDDGQSWRWDEGEQDWVLEEDA